MPYALTKMLDNICRKLRFMAMPDQFRSIGDRLSWPALITAVPGKLTKACILLSAHTSGHETCVHMLHYIEHGSSCQAAAEASKSAVLLLLLCPQNSAALIAPFVSHSVSRSRQSWDGLQRP
jgi:hypothetical protein